MTELKTFQIFVDGKWQDSKSGEFFESFYPFTGKAWARIPRCNESDADLAVGAALNAHEKPEWSGLNASQRGHLLRRLGDIIDKNAEMLGQVEVQDNGKLIAEMGMQCKYLSQWFYYYGGLADKIEGSVLPIDKPDTFTYTRHESLGVCVMITPWNSPLLLLTI